MVPGAHPRAAGRPRNPEADQAILGTALRLLVEQGYDAMSIEGVAAAAGVGKTTIYRRYPGKRELVIAAITSIAASLGATDGSGNARNDLRAFFRQTIDVVSRDGLGFAMVGTLLAKEREDPELLALFRARVIRPRVEIARRILAQGIERGELRPDTDVDIVAQVLAGAVFAGRIIGVAEDDPWLDHVFDTIWRGIAPVERVERTVR